MMIRFAIVCSLVLALVTTCSTQAEEAESPAWVVAWKGVEDYRYPEYTVTHGANILAEYMSKVLGVEVGTAAWPDAKAKTVLLLTEAKHAPADVQEALAGKCKDAFVIKYPYEYEGRTVCLLATRDNVAHDFSAYYFLTHFMDVHWVGPGELGEVYTVQAGWTLPESIDVLANPDFEHRFWNMKSFLGRQWLGRSMRMSWHHALGHVFDPKKYAEEHPEVYPMLKTGERYNPVEADGTVRYSGWQPCTSNPKSIEIATQHVIEDLKNNPTRICSSLSVNDGAGNICLCEPCRALDEPGAFAPGQRPELSDRFFTFYNRVIENVLKVNPEAYIAALRYGPIRNPPKRVKVHPRIQVFHVIPSIEQLCKWAPTGAGANMHLWQYDGGFLLIRPDMRMQAELIRVAHTLGGVGVYSEVIPHWPSCGPRFYVFSHLLWDADSDVDELYADFFRHSYGPNASPHVHAYYRCWDAVFNRMPRAWQYSPGYTWRRMTQFKYLRRDDMAAMHEALAAARAADMSERERERLGYLLTYHEWLGINADQYLLSTELSDPEWIGDRTFKELAAIVTPSLDLTERFDRIWDEQIKMDDTGWFTDVNYRRRIDQRDENYNAQLRMLVASAHDTSIDAGFGIVIDREVAIEGKEAVLASLGKRMKAYPALEAYIGPQVNRLKGIATPNLVANGGFEKGSAGEPNPEVTDWLTYQVYGMMKGTENEYRWGPGTGHDGGSAYGLGSGEYAELRAPLKLEKGRRYSLSLWYRTENREDQPASFWIFSHDGEIEDLANINHREKIKRFMMFKLAPTDGAWERFACTFSPSRGGNFIIQPAAARQKPGQWVWFDDIEIRKLW